MTMAKGLTNGVVPMGAVAVKDEIYETVVNAAPEKSVEFFHGYTYTACPVACAASLAALDIYEKEGLFERSAQIAPYFLDAVFSLQDLDLITDIRGFGLLAGIDLAPDKAPGIRGYEALQRFYEAGLMGQLTGDGILLAPPLIVENAEIDFMVDTIRTVVEGL